jgi:hypothetical protein
MAEPKKYQGLVVVEVEFDSQEDYNAIDGWLKANLSPEYVTGAAVLGNVELDSVLTWYDGVLKKDTNRPSQLN